MEQFTPTVSDADVERVIRRDLPVETHEEIWAIIKQIEVREKPRVILACLKNGGGDIQKLKHNLAWATDYREIIGEAEYPNWTKKMFHIEKLSEAEQNKIIEKDKDQYLAWLYRTNE